MRQIHIKKWVVTIRQKIQSGVDEIQYESEKRWHEKRIYKNLTKMAFSLTSYWRAMMLFGTLKTGYTTFRYFVHGRAMSRSMHYDAHDFSWPS